MKNRVRTVLKPSATAETALAHRLARYIAAGIYGVYSRDAIKDYRVLLLGDGRLFCTCDASIDYDLLKGIGLTRYSTESKCWHKAAVARRLLRHPEEIQIALR